MQIKHSVLMVSYNQEKYIGHALDSIFNNTVLPDEVIILDDHSIDKTWDIIQDFKARYPSIIKCDQNKENVGIYKNMSALWTAAKNSSCDVFSWCSGDDFLYAGLFEELNCVIEKDNIDLQDDFIIITNSSELYLNGEKKIINNYKLRQNDLFKARIRGGLSYREVGISKNVIKKMGLIRDDIGLWGDLLFVLDFETKCKKFYFSSFVASCYRVGVGTVSHTKILEVMKSKIQVNNEIMYKYCNRLDNADRDFLRMENSFFRLYKDYNFSNLISFILWFFKNILHGERIKKDYISILIPSKIKKVIKRVP
ncbi:hypothetical protein FACS189473_3710 [Spirochaetia bacterium]|nr:hypothetical protein FACS189473_3710 [Spirochaetia bacterium]